MQEVANWWRLPPLLAQQAALSHIILLSDLFSLYCRLASDFWTSTLVRQVFTPIGRAKVCQIYGHSERLSIMENELEVLRARNAALLEAQAKALAVQEQLAIKAGLVLTRAINAESEAQRARERSDVRSHPIARQGAANPSQFQDVHLPSWIMSQRLRASEGAIHGLNRQTRSRSHEASTRLSMQVGFAPPQLGPQDVAFGRSAFAVRSYGTSDGWHRPASVGLLSRPPLPCTGRRNLSSDAEDRGRFSGATPQDVEIVDDDEPQCV